MNIKSLVNNKLLLTALIILVLAAAYLLFAGRPQGPTAKIYFLRDEKLCFVERPVPKRTDLVSLAAFELLAGPTPDERKAGIFTEIPQGTKIIKIKKSGSDVIVTFSRDLEKYGGGSAKIRGLVAQIVYTFTEIPGVEKIQIRVAGKNEVVLGGEGYVIDSPLSREDAKL